MQAKANIIIKYANSDGYGKINIICNNYSNFLCMVDVHEKRIKREIIEEKLFNRTEDRGNLGVRVKTSRSCSSPVETEALNNVELDEAISTGRVPAGLIVGTDDDETHTLEIMTLKIMRDNYKEFLKNLDSLQKKEKRLFMNYLESDKELEEIADDEGILYHSMVQKIAKVKHNLVFQMGL